MRFAYADPPYIGQAKKLYGKHRDYAFASAGLQKDDEFADLFPGSGAVGRAWTTFDPGPTIPDGYAESKRA